MSLLEATTAPTAACCFMLRAARGVRIDAAKKPILRADLLFRAVEGPAGHYPIEFFFEPLSIANFAAVGRTLLQRRRPVPETQ